MRLSNESFQSLLDAERGLTGIVAELDNAEKCGIECQNYRASLRAQLAEIANLKAYFAPQ
jgi:hypothetical protein